MKMELLDVQGFRPAIMSSRAAMKSYDKCDTTGWIIGPNDEDLFRRLIKGGGPHCKCIRQIIAWFSVQAPRFWWQEFDTYRIGVDKGSESTMHKIHSRHLMAEDFDGEDISGQMLIDLNTLIDLYNKEKNPDLFLALKRRLPEGFLQTRYVEASYQALRGMYFWRRNHRLLHWREFCEWLTTLPNAWIITMEGHRD